MKEELNVLYQSDDKFAIYMGVSVYSLLKNNSSENRVNIYVIDDQISRQHKNELQETVSQFGQKLMFLPAERILNSGRMKNYPTYTGFRENAHSFLKMFLDDILPQDISRIIYIDADTVVCGPLAPLLSLAMGKHPIAMALSSAVNEKNKRSIGLCEGDCYYNSGVILFDMNNWREKRCSGRIIEHMTRKRKYGTVDQDVLNVEFKDDIVTLPAAYNMTAFHMVYKNKLYFKNFKCNSWYYTEEELQEAVRKPVVIHFIKWLNESPWDKGNLHPAASYFDDYLMETPWRGLKKKRKKKRMIYRIEKILYIGLPKWLFLKLFTYFHTLKLSESNKMS